MKCDNCAQPATRTGFDVKRRRYAYCDYCSIFLEVKSA